MMIGETHRSNPTAEVPPWDYYSDDLTANSHPPFSLDKCAFTALQGYLPSNDKNGVVSSSEWGDFDVNVDAFASDNFRIYEFKVRRCARARSHDWTDCPFAHPGEKARRRDPRKFHYSGDNCPDFRKGQCVRGDACEYAHGVFECWLHPARYRTQPCKDGTDCRRKICFFAHTADQLRLLPPSSPRIADGFGNESLRRLGIDSFGRKLSPTSTLYSPPSSPPMSPCESVGFNSVSELVGSMRSMKIRKVTGGMSMSPPAWGGAQMDSGFGSFRLDSRVRPGFASLPGTPTRRSARSGVGVFDLWDQSCEEEPVMERVESGRDLRAKIYAKLSRENSLARGNSVGSGPDVEWVSELVK